MKCTKCGNPAIIKLAYANLYLCDKHFVEWFENRVEKTVDKYNMLENTKKLAIAVSGGKDSTTLLHVMTKIAQKRGIDIIGITIDLGIDMGKKYSSNSVEFAVKNYEMLGVKYRVIRIKEEYGFTIDKARFKIRRPVCSTCGLTKRYVLEKVAKEEGADTLATGHNLNDISQYVLTGYYNGDILSLARLSPVSPAENGYIKKIKPLFLSSEKETMTYAIIKKIPFLYQSCPHTFRVGGETQDKIRRSIEEIEDKVPGFMLSLVQNFESKFRPLMADIPKATLGKCKICGMPTNNNRDICSFCATRLKMTVKAK
ncbi:adenine nucleotide alpha hydrolase family protein [Acidianus sulfidivorans JP7]|uniref:PP-loop domain-containing protein n=1 Tax=Acidianus sulfidivorans JP7 TaxID=619593 RepID=A0A2U9IQL6_9CREN|nr:ATP-binding protein [Acidianus sulfidivorans]AWR98283.1 adenine nucleotide alpha hydrolase family protein [Acidianus sulfidivorans JP7]